MRALSQVKQKFNFNVSPRFYQPKDNNCFVIHNEKSFFFPFLTLLHHSESFQVVGKQCLKVYIIFFPSSTNQQNCFLVGNTTK